MTEQKDTQTPTHTPEPWRARYSIVYFKGNVGGFDLRDCPSPEANARRIVACVNACAGISNEHLELTTVAQMVAAAVTQRDKLERERNALYEALKATKTEIKSIGADTPAHLWYPLWLTVCDALALIESGTSGKGA